MLKCSMYKVFISNGDECIETITTYGNGEVLSIYSELRCFARMGQLHKILRDISGISIFAVEV